ncbi:MAG: tetratricopeptide repeat protein [Silvanigrellales bacterium]|nr:tetratricopeptide repeat protein [Silvanigrellales bacterium]
MKPTAFGVACAFVFLALATGCASRNYTNFLLDEPIERSASLEENGPALKPEVFAGQGVMKVRWNDGRVFTEVDVPLFASGQRIVVEHSGAVSQDASAAQKPKTVVAPPPAAADKTLSEAYRDRGLKENAQAPDVSISRTRGLMQDAIRLGNYTLALEYCEAVLARYPSHPEFLRAKGSILLLVGEREKAMETYEKAEEVESDPKVKAKLQELRKNAN